MIVRATSDLHLSERTARYVFAALAELRVDARERGGQTVLVGDVLDQPETVHMPTYNRLRDELAAFEGGDVYVVAGNHDQYRGYRNALEGLSSPGVHVISEPQWTALGLMVPYTTPEDFWATIARMLDIMPDDAPPVWWTHQGWSGAYLNNMVKDRDGLSPARIKAEAVITGHYHMPQNIGPIIYCGSPYQTTFAEEGQIKSWLRFDGKSNIPTRVPYQSVGAPNHWTIHWDPATGEPTIPDGYTDGDKLRVVTTATKSVVKASRGQLKAAGLDGVPVLAKPDTAIRRVIARSASPVEAALQFVESSHGPDAGMPSPANMEEWAEESGLWD